VSRKLAVVLFNLGGPDGPEAVRPFLFNLFRDPAIIGLPAIFRYPLAALISTRREKTAKANYAIMGGGSPLLPETEKQARALEAQLAAGARGPAGGRSQVLHRHALLEPADGRDRQGRGGVRAGRHRAAAALSAVFGHHDGVIAEGLG
jgi:protoheme ferro-lyase